MIFKYCNNPDDEVPIFCIEEQVGTTAGEESEAEKTEDGVIGSKFSEELKFIDSLGKKGIEVHINSQGGYVKDGYSIFYAILHSKTPVTTICTGMAASIAGVIFEAGAVRKMTDYSFIMIHNPSGGEDEILKQMRAGLVTMLAKRSGMSEDEMSKIMENETYYDSDEAKKLGLCDEIIVTPVANRLKNEIKNALSGKPNLITVTNILANIKNDLTKPKTMKKVINLLNTKCSADLADDASEGEIKACVEALIKAKNEAEKKAEDTQKEIDALNKKMEKLEKDSEEYAKLKEEMDKLIEEGENLAKEEADKKAEDAVNAAIKAGKIKDTAKATIKAQYLKDPKFTQEVLDAMTASAKAPKLEVMNVEQGADKGGYAAKAMAARLKAIQDKK